MERSPLSRRVNWTAALIVLALYPFAAYLLVREYDLAAGVLGVIPVGIVGIFFGWAAGITAGVLFVFINYGIASLAVGTSVNWRVIVTNENFLLDAVILFVVGVLSGWAKHQLTGRMMREAELVSYEQYLSLLNKTTQAIILSKNPDEMMASLTKDLQALMNADDCYITQWDEDQQKTIPMHTTAKLADAYESMNFSSDLLTLTQSVIREGRPLAVDDVFNSPYISPEIASQFPVKSMLGLPLIHGDRKLGAILIAHNTPHKFSQEEVSRAEQVANQLAIAVWNARQDFELQRQLKETDTLNNIAQALSQGERVGLSNLLNLIADSAKDLIPGAEQAVIHLLDEGGEFLAPKAVSGIKDRGGRAKMRLGEGVAGQVIANGETINIRDVNSDERFYKTGQPPRFRSLMVAPIISGGQSTGTISVQSEMPGAFTDTEKKLLSALGTQAAIAIENAHLLENTQQSLLETNALYRISQGLVSLNTAELLKDVVDLLQRNFGYYHVQVFIKDPETGDFVLEAGSGEVGKRLKSEKFRLKAGAGIVGYAGETSAPFFTNNVDEIVFFIRNPYLPETKSEMAVPVKSGEKTLGVLDIQQAPPNLFSQRDLQLVSAVADQLAVALQKADLYQNLQISLEQEKLMRDQLVQSERLAMMGKLLASVSHELNNPLQAIQNALFLLKGEPGISVQGSQDLEIVLSETERMATMIERLRATYRPIQAEDFTPVQINTIVEDVYALVATHFRHRGISFEFFPDTTLPVIPGLPDQIRQVILNLFMNAADAMNGGGVLSVTTSHIENKGEAFLSISDDGTGIDPAILPNVFDAFITNKTHGTGLGLTICYDIIAKHQGRITAGNNPTRGASFNIWLPTSRMDAS